MANLKTIVLMTLSFLSANAALASPVSLNILNPDRSQDRLLKPYMIELRKKIQDVWLMHADNSRFSNELFFQISPTGELDIVTVKRSSTNLSFDNQTVLAITSVAPFKTPPQRDPIRIEAVFDSHQISREELDNARAAQRKVEPEKPAPENPPGGSSPLPLPPPNPTGGLAPVAAPLPPPPPPPPSPPPVPAQAPPQPARPPASWPQPPPNPPFPVRKRPVPQFAPSRQQLSIKQRKDDYLMLSDRTVWKARYRSDVSGWSNGDDVIIVDDDAMVNLSEHGDKADVKKLSELSGYSLCDESTVTGSFEGADYGKVTKLDNGMIFEFNSYNYDYSYRPDCMIMCAGAGMYKLIIENEIYDVTRIK